VKTSAKTPMPSTSRTTCGIEVHMNSGASTTIAHAAASSVECDR
jgi:hypothetical protein